MAFRIPFTASLRITPENESFLSNESINDRTNGSIQGAVTGANLWTGFTYTVAMGSAWLPIPYPAGIPRYEIQSLEEKQT